MRDDKYVVLKIEDAEMIGKFSEETYAAIREKRLEDAVVIRTQDIFAGPALWVYAHVLALAAKTGTSQHSRRFQEIADYFSARATEADAQDGKVPD